MSCSNVQQPGTAWALALLGACIALGTAGMGRADEEIRLTEDGRLKRDPVFIKDGDELVFGVDESTDRIRLMRFELATRKQQPLHETAPRSELEPAFSRTGKHYAFNQNTGNLSLKLVIRNAETGADVDLPVKGRGGMRSPTFSPDGRHLVYCFAEKGPQQLFQVDLAGKNKKQLTDSQGMNNWPSFTPDGKSLVFSSSRDGNYEIYVMQLGGSKVRRLTTNDRQDIRPRLSPDGRRIAFTSTRDGNREIYVMDRDGKNARRLTTHPERDDYPAWHPDGRRLVVVSERRGKSDLYLIAVD